MNETRTTAMLQRVPKILAVTAHSYGLELKAPGPRKPQAAGGKHREASHKSGDKPATH